MEIRKRPVRKDNLPARFTKEYLEERGEVTPSGCILWTKSLNGVGYAQVGEWPYNAHVISYVLYRGPLSEGDLVRHLCHNRNCINPEHLEKGNHRDNWLDSEPRHRRAYSRRKGSPAKNKIPVTVDGRTFASKVEAMKTLKRGPRYIEKFGIKA